MQKLHQCESLQHKNVLKFTGTVKIGAHGNGHFHKAAPGFYYLVEDPGKTTLHDLVHTSPYNLNNRVKCLMAVDIAKGMAFLHRKGILHGQIDPWNCVVDQSWTIKVCGATVK